jgi:hypothetical protein
MAVFQDDVSHFFHLDTEKVEKTHDAGLMAFWFRYII